MLRTALTLSVRVELVCETVSHPHHHVHPAAHPSLWWCLPFNERRKTMCKSEYPMAQTADSQPPQTLYLKNVNQMTGLGFFGITFSTCTVLYIANS